MVNNNKITIEEGQLITVHITRLEAPRPSCSRQTSSNWVAWTGEEEPGGDGGVEDFCGRGEVEFARGKNPRGVVLFKNSERMFRESKSESEMSAAIVCF